MPFEGAGKNYNGKSFSGSAELQLVRAQQRTELMVVKLFGLQEQGTSLCGSYLE